MVAPKWSESSESIVLEEMFERVFIDDLVVKVRWVADMYLSKKV